ncbi:oligosaccharide biosynthesis protein Alg14-like protein [Aspergillus cavernicola]|uniref:UDP-N-acetylglucosamine transferase subunit ALG14 n=1 Tax=Aspergillus cavernicola TaxID=176166 RepID=A0ABR4ILQ2_9EURO
MALFQLSLTGLLAWGLLCLVVGCISVVILLHALAISQSAPVPKWRHQSSPVHFLVVLGSGGHTAEMLSMLRRMQLDPIKYTYRTYIVSSGDSFSATKAVEFESTLVERGAAPGSYTVVTVPRARRVHQSYFTAPFTTIQSFYSCLLVLRGLHSDQQALPAELPSPYPDIILTNGPATAVCVILAARLLRMYHYCLRLLFPARMHFHARSMAGATTHRSAPLSDEFRLRTIFVESWARVTTLSLSGKILLPFADRFLVQWPALGGKSAWKGMKKTEYVGFLVD